jgi:hypothetical protein
MASRGCINGRDIFCYICGRYVVLKRRRNITGFVKNACFAYFGIKVGDQDKEWAPQKVCRTCIEGLRSRKVGKKLFLPFAVPMAWRDPRNRTHDCYFCLGKVEGYSDKNKDICSEISSSQFSSTHSLNNTCLTKYV